MKVIFEGEDIPITLWKSTRLNFIGFFFNNFLPTAVGGDIVKAHCASQAGVGRIRAYTSVMMDRIIGLYSFIFVAAVALLIDNGRFKIKSLRIIVFFCLIAGIIAFFILTNKRMENMTEKILARIKFGKIGEKLNSFAKIIYDYRNRKDVVIKSLLLSIVSQSIYFITMYMFFLSLGSNVSIGNVFLIMPIVTMISMIPSIGGLGVREGAIVALFTPIIGRTTAFAGSMLLLFGLFTLSLIGGIFYLEWNISNKKKNGRRDE
ncbi:protein belonging to Lysylphosphatidylglycerol synthetase/UPF0104 [Candidatus Omnitrophus magneticus]|uniref:Protein belonging to Lysylphosphatidylglycerol synthetase/UPF0104 n=1 Tax=Candidatus Omnitrophus magneticus TaxID=1609969 RepID=A0A0F0CQC3_9BACT|nr:protein belonging to Lysylphosphatidylglycerol synthetase/UPF0104 [Candidatus Omnitrophus magneticus]